MNAGTVLGLALAALWTLDALRLRGRLRRLAVLAPSEEEPSPDHVFIARAGVTLDEGTRKAASQHARELGLEALDLVPTRMHAWRAFLVALAVDPARFRSGRLAHGYSAGDALLLDRALVERMNLPAAPAPMSAGGLVDLARLVKQYAPTTTGIALAPALRSPATSIQECREILGALLGEFGLLILLVQFALVGVALALAPRAGLCALGAFELQVVLVLAGTALAPRGLLVYALGRPLIDLAYATGSGLGRKRTRDESEEARAIYAGLLAQGTSPFFEARREDCPLCASRALRPFLRIGDRYQFKPGRFALERCADCAHIFQNPRLSPEGLDFYYRDFYDGLGEKSIGTLFGASDGPYLARAKMVAAFTTPRRWLDVGAGHGHFCCVARDVFRDARFDGLDLGEGVEIAARKRWIDRAIRGLFPEVAPALAAAGERYDVVSMSHYLEHTRDPAAEIAAAAHVLAPGGLLMVEVPDPESKLGHLFGKNWMPWFQPQHQHFLHWAALDRLLRDNQLEPLSWHRGEAHTGGDFMFLTTMFAGWLAGPLDLPWLPRTGPLGRTWHGLVWVGCAPVVGIAHLVDLLVAPLLRRAGWSNAYRVVARRNA